MSGGDRRVLLVHDGPGDVDLVRRFLADGTDPRWELDAAGDLAAARRALGEKGYDLVLTDLGLTDSAGMETFHAIRKAAEGVPILVLTGRADSQLGRGAVAEGAEDHIPKDELSPALLRRSMIHALERARRAEEFEGQERIAPRADRLALIGRVVGGIAHEFNNLLTAIQGFAQFLEADPSLDEDQRESVAEILAASKRASGITRQLLSYTRRQILSPAPFDLNACVLEMRALLESTLGRRFVLRLGLADDPVLADAERSQIEHAVMHLVTNAATAMPNGGVVEISTRFLRVPEEGSPPSLEPGDYAVVEVRDNGPGMPREILERAREPFFTTRPFGEAMGLGLATVDGIAHQSGGTLALESGPGEGTTARIYLPRARETAEPPR